MPRGACAATARRGEDVESKKSAWSHERRRWGLASASPGPPERPYERYGLAADALDRDALRRQHLVLQRVHAARRPRRCAARTRASPAGSASAARDPGCARPGYSCSTTRWVFGDVERQQLARGELVIEPVHRPVLQIRQRIVTRGAGQLVLAEHGLLLPRVDLIGGAWRRLAVAPSRRAPSSGRRSPRPRRPSRRRPVPSRESRRSGSRTRRPSGTGRSSACPAPSGSRATGRSGCGTDRRRRASRRSGAARSRSPGV